MSTKLVVLAAVLGALVFSGGCSSMIYMATSKAGSETPPQMRSGSTLADVKAKLGKPVAVRSLPDGGQVATYEYRMPDGAAGEKAKDSLGFHLSLWKELREAGVVISVLAEPVLMGMAIHRAANPPRGRVLLIYGPDGRLLDYDSPPAYGPPEDAVESPSVGALRGSCWSSDRDGLTLTGTEVEERATEDGAYVECLARRFAIWGID